MIKFDFRYDSLTFYDGNSTDALMLGKYCGDSNPEEIISTKNEMFIQFKTNIGRTGKGFEIKYQSGEFHRKSSYTIILRIVTNVIHFLSTHN